MPPRPISRILPFTLGFVFSFALVAAADPLGPYPKSTPKWAQIYVDLLFALIIFCFMVVFALAVWSLCGCAETDTGPQALANENPQRLADEVRLLRARVQQLEADGTRLNYGSVASTEPSEARISPPPYAESEGRKVPAVDP
ncbi:hypothetical protein B0H19DRAFT_1383319 [Mycena capillaripes]|nr:hypothetical protein B0H19DRAFT_1383319 [Mycena capillaripes]